MLSELTTKQVEHNSKDARAHSNSVHHWNQELPENPLSRNWAITKSLNDHSLIWLLTVFGFVANFLSLSLSNSLFARHWSRVKWFEFHLREDTSGIMHIYVSQNDHFSGLALHVIQLNDSIDSSFLLHYYFSIVITLISDVWCFECSASGKFSHWK